jgi:hypothetical protein
VPHRIGYEYISALLTIHSVEAGVVPESGPEWAQDAELFNWEQIQARLRVCVEDIKEADDRRRKDLASESKGATYYQMVIRVSWLAKACWSSSRIVMCDAANSEQCALANSSVLMKAAETSYRGN